MSRRRNIYPMDANDPNVRWCKDCEYAYMPDSGCVTHVGRCLTCCGFGCRGPVTQAPAWPVDFIFRILQRDMRTTAMLNRPCLDLWCRWVRDLERAASATTKYRAKVQADIDALYGAKEDR